MTDHQLLEAYTAARDTRAFSCFVDRHEARLISYAGALLRDSGLAQDVAQEVFFKVARHPERVLEFFDRTQQTPELHGARNWLLKVARELSLDRLRKRYLEKREWPNVEASRPASPATAVDQKAEANEELDRMRVAIQKLSPRLRELVVLKVQQHKSYKEIAELTGLTATHVGVLLHQALQELAKELNP